VGADDDASGEEEEAEAAVPVILARLLLADLRWLLLLPGLFCWLVPGFFQSRYVSEINEVLDEPLSATDKLI
jgi:hypothetical protein